jgi:hypothetical protein
MEVVVMPEGIGYAMPQASPLRNTTAPTAQRAQRNAEPPTQVETLKTEEEPPREEKDFLGSQIDYSA